jgi:hypothetical protein
VPSGSVSMARPVSFMEPAPLPIREPTAARITGVRPMP